MSVLSRVGQRLKTPTRSLAWRKKSTILTVAVLQAVSLSLPVLMPQYAQAASLEASAEVSSETTTDLPSAPNENGRSGMAMITMQTQSQDKTGPQVTFTSPAAGAVVGDTDIQAKISDPSKVDRYWFTITGPKNWETSVEHPGFWDWDKKNISVSLNLCAEDKLDLCRESKLPSGTYTVRATAYDERENVSNTTTTTFVFDADGPSVSITNPASGASVNKVLVSGTISDQKLDYFRVGLSKVGDWGWDFWTRDYNVGNGQTTHTLSQLDLLNAAKHGVCDGWPCSWYNNMPALPDGMYTLRVNAYDKFGNKTEYTHNFTLDTKAPSVPALVSPANNAVVSTQVQAIANDWTDVAGAAQYRYQSYGLNGNGTCNFSNVLVTELYTASQTASRSLVEGTFCWRVQALDAAGNESAWSPAWKLTVDNTAPAVPTLVSPANNAVINAKKKAFANDWSTVADAVQYRYQSYNVAANGDCDLSSVRFTSLYAVSQTESRTLADGSFCWQVTSIDALGNESAWSQLWKVTVDNTPPKAQLLTPANGDLVRGTVTISGVITDANPYRYRLVVRNSNGVIVDGPKTVYQADVTDFNWNTELVPDGDYTIHLRAMDAAGNKNGSSVDVIAVTVDNTVPVVKVNALTTTATSPALTGEINDPAATLTVTVNGETYDDTVLVVSGDAWTLPAGVIAPALAVGTYTVRVTATDLVGNSAFHEATLTITQVVNNAPPVITPGVSVASVTTPQVFGAAIRTIAQNNTQTQTETTTPQVASASTIADTSNETENEEAKKPATEAANDKKSNTWMWFLGAAVVVLFILALLYRRFSKALDK